MYFFTPFVLFLIYVIVVLNIYNHHNSTKKIRNNTLVAASTVTTVSSVVNGGGDCMESKGLARMFTNTGDLECLNYTQYTDTRGKIVGGNCNGHAGVISSDGHLHCDCPPVIDSVTGRLIPSKQIEVNGLQVCVENEELYEVD